jgi:hypothetical protein
LKLTAVCGIIGPIFYAAAIAIIGALHSADIFESYTGLLQRVSMGLPLVWMEVVSIKLFRLAV